VPETAEAPHARARQWFREQGLSVTEWSMARGFTPALVHVVLKGERKCLRGQSFKIAVALGLRPPPPTRELGH
jgi:gp16 family phage-associated protein